MEYADRGTLVDYFDNLDRHTPAADWRRLCADVANGLQVIHKSGIFHGDLKLENVLVVTDGESGTVFAKLSDFGGAVLEGASLTSSKSTPPWTAPEWKVKRSRKRHQSSDVYALALLMWRIALSGADPFEDVVLFTLSKGFRERIAKLDAEKQNDEQFLAKAKRSVAKCHTNQDTELIGSIFACSLRVAEGDRDLEATIQLLNGADKDTASSTSETDSNEGSSSESGSIPPISQDEPVPFSFAGSEYTPLTMTLQPKILESMAHALIDPRGDRKIEAAIALAMMNLVGDDFGLHSNHGRGLKFLTLAAMLGSVDHRVLIYRMHKAFDRAIPDEVSDHFVSWLEEGAARGSLIAAEDLRELGLYDELEKARKVLRSRNCGIGVDIVAFDEEADVILLSSDAESIHAYLAAQMEEGRRLGQNFSEYFLMLASAYGNALAVKMLIRDFGAEVNRMNEIGNTALLQAAFSGHSEVTQLLLDHGADPSIANSTGETALHWLCNFDDEDVPATARALVDANGTLDAIAEEFIFGYGFYETEFISGTPLHRAVARNSLVAVETLLELGADPFVLGFQDRNTSPFMLAVLLHYPIIVQAFLSKATDLSAYMISPDGTSILKEAFSGGTLYGSTFGRLIRHGDKLASRAQDTIQILLDTGAKDHLSNLPGFSDCTALFYAAQSHTSVLGFLLTVCPKEDIDRPASRTQTELDPHTDERRPPLFEAVLYGKLDNIRTLLDNDVNPATRYNPERPTTILHQCALAGLQDVELLTRFLDSSSLSVDDGPKDHETPFICAVLNRAFVAAEFFRDRGADVNALCRTEITGTRRNPTTLLSVLAEENSPGSLACIEFLFRDDAPSGRLTQRQQRSDFIVEPAINMSIFHTLASLAGDEQDSASTLGALDLCWTYFDPGAAEMNMVTTPDYARIEELAAAASGERDDDGAGTHDAANSVATTARISGGNTLLHFAALGANVAVARYFLTGTEPGSVDTSVVNGVGLTALGLAEKLYGYVEEEEDDDDVFDDENDRNDDENNKDSESNEEDNAADRGLEKKNRRTRSDWRPSEFVPTHPKKQRLAARRRRRELLLLLREYSMG